MSDATTILESIRTRLAELRPLVEEVEALERAEAVLSEHMPDYETITQETDEHYAPYGYKPDGTPYKRRPPTQEQIEQREAKRQATLTRKRNSAARRRTKSEMRLNVLSSTHPTEQELKDREVVHTTEEPGVTYSVDELVTVAKAGSAAVAKRLDPDDDWAPILLGLTHDRKVELIQFPITDETKDVLVHVLRDIAREHDFKAMVTVVTAWMTVLDTQERREVLMIQAIDPEVMRFEHAVIERRPDAHPLLGPWEPFGGDDMVGRFTELRDALR